jgi:hypothetical protein
MEKRTGCSAAAWRAWKKWPAPSKSHVPDCSTMARDLLTSPVSQPVELGRTNVAAGRINVLSYKLQGLLANKIAVTDVYCSRSRAN